MNKKIVGWQDADANRGAGECIQTVINFGEAMVGPNEVTSGM
jgi:hypothetical protein